MKFSRTKREFPLNSSSKLTPLWALKCFCQWCCSFSQVSHAVRTSTGTSAITKSTLSKTLTRQISPKQTRRLEWLLLQDLLANLVPLAKWISLVLMALNRRSISTLSRRKFSYLWLLTENLLNLEQTTYQHLMKRQSRVPKTSLSQTLSQTNFHKLIKSSGQRSLTLWSRQVRTKFPHQMLSDCQTQYQKALLWSFQLTLTHPLSRWFLHLLST